MAGVCADIRLVVGLGNIGDRYAGTRHNVGFWYADGLAGRLGVAFRTDRRLPADVARVTSAGPDLRLIKPGSLMNRSGGPVAAVANFFRIPVDAIVVAHDDLDLPPGTIRLKRGGGHGGHNGLRDLDARLGSKDYWRLRIGIGHPGDRDAVTAHVLGKPAPAERESIEAAIDRALEVTDDLLVEGNLEAAMNALHAPR